MARQEVFSLFSCGLPRLLVTAAWAQVACKSLFSVLMLAQTDVMVSATEQTANPCDHVHSVACTSLSKIASEEIMIRPKIGPFILLMN